MPSDVLVTDRGLGHDEDGRGGVRDNRRGDAALELSQEPVAPMRPEHDQARMVFVCRRNDALPGRHRLNCLAAHQESGCLGQ